MPEQFLDVADGVTRLEHVGRACVPEHMRVHMSGDPLATCPVVHAELHGAATQTTTPPPHKPGMLTVHDELAPYREPALHGLHCVRAHRDDARYIPFSEHTHSSVLRIDVAAVESGELTQPQCGCVEQFHDGAVADSTGVLSRRNPRVLPRSAR